MARCLRMAGRMRTCFSFDGLYGLGILSGVAARVVGKVHGLFISVTLLMRN